MTEAYLSAEAAAGRTILLFFQALDERRYGDQCALMEDTGTWLRQGKLLHGPDEIHAAMGQRPADIHTAHLVANLDVQISSAGADASFLMQVFAHHGSAAGEMPPPALSQIARYSVALVRDGSEWRIRSIRSIVLFKA